MTRWKDFYDLELVRAHKQGATDTAIYLHLLDKGYPITRMDVINARKRLHLNPNKAAPSYEKPAPPKEKPNPLTMAKAWLGNRLTEKDGLYRLDNVPKSVKDIMQVVNQMRANMGLDQVGPEHWRVK